MRTTLTLDDDVAASLRKRRTQRGTGLREEVNALLRAALLATDSETEPTDYEPPKFDPGRALLTDYRELLSMLDDEDSNRGITSTP